ncbi:MAG: bifunctional riboflavin kinase/FAD synthetase [Xanthomonadales bacterium]|nr:bifunctional riboflavin kinase/FAD synthetase [Xanthomonadales bacterium]
MLRLFRDIDGPAMSPQGCVACVGAFDGLHLGHQALIERTVERARDLGLPAAVVCFEPLPREFFSPDDPPPRLMLPGARLRMLDAMGVDIVGQLRFNKRLTQLDAVEFIGRILVDRLHACEVWVGPDFRFGRGRGGDITVLREHGERAGFIAAAIEPLALDGERVSSSVIRNALSQGDFATAARLLGRPYAIGGRVVRGKQLGRKLGFPTANLRFGKRPALQGIYATWVHGVADRPWPSVSSFGTRPTVDGVEPLLEAHLFDWNSHSAVESDDGDLYGKRIDVEFVAKLRDEEKFDGLDALTAQMERDAAAARTLLQ